jgi:hypothetical protein
MSTLSLEALADRIDRLEAQNRRLKQVALSVALASSVLAMVGFKLARNPSQVEAERFVVKDARGNMRASLSLREGEPTLALFDSRGREQVLLRSAPDHASTLEFYQRGHLRMALESSTAGASQLTMLDSDHQLAAGLYVWPEGSSGLALNRGQAGARLAVKNDGTASLGFADPEGTARGGLMMGLQGSVSPIQDMAEAGPANGRPYAVEPIRDVSHALELIDACGGQGAFLGDPSKPAA